MAKTITIFLPDDNPAGVKIVELSNRTIQAFLIPRAKLTEIKDRQELNRPAIYVLCDREGKQVYIGECENFFHRIRSHDQGKEFWEIAIAFVAKDNGLDKGDVKFLESLAIQQAKQAGRAKLMNVTAPVQNNLHEFKMQTILEFFEDLKIIISALGYPVFDRVKTEQASESDLWYCARRATKAKAIYDENGFTVLAGSIIDGTHQPSFIKYYPYAVAEREQLFAEKAKTNDGGKTFELTENITFSSANKAGGFVVGANVNAWTNWKNSKGQTMDVAMRKSG